MQVMVSYHPGECFASRSFAVAGGRFPGASENALRIGGKTLRPWHLSEGKRSAAAPFGLPLPPQGAGKRSGEVFQAGLGRSDA